VFDLPFAPPPMLPYLKYFSWSSKLVNGLPNVPRPLHLGPCFLPLFFPLSPLVPTEEWIPRGGHWIEDAPLRFPFSHAATSFLLFPFRTFFPDCILYLRDFYAFFRLFGDFLLFAFRSPSGAFMVPSPPFCPLFTKTLSLLGLSVVRGLPPIRLHT